MGTKTLPQFENLGSMITYDDGGDKPRCLGYLMDFKERGVFDANFGRVEISPEHAEAHNKALDTAYLKGLDQSCEIGQHGTFYIDEVKKTVKTFMGTLVSADVRIVGKMITFRRAGKVYRGRTQKDADCFNFKRVS